MKLTSLQHLKSISICLLLIVWFVFSNLAFFTQSALASEPNGYWDEDYSFYQPLTITNNSSGTLSAGYSVSYTFDHDALVSVGKSLNNGADIRIAYWNDDVWVELDRALDSTSEWNSTTTKIWFKSQADIAPSGTDADYYLYYGNSNATNPVYQTTDNNTYLSIRESADNILELTHGLFNDGAEYWKAGTIYTDAWVWDISQAMSKYPEYFTDEQVEGIYLKAINTKNGGGHYAASIAPSGAGSNYFSGCDALENHTLGDPIWAIPTFAKLYYDRTGDLTLFNANSADIKAAMASVPRSATTSLVYSDPAEPWISWGYHDGVLKTGDDLMGSLLYYNAALKLSDLYAASGDTVNAAFFQNEASDIEDNLDALWSEADGMFYAASIDNDQIDIDGSAFAVYLGIATPSQITAISNYLVDNYDSIVHNGYIRRSPVNWESSWGGNQCGRGVGKYDDGYWTVAATWVTDALRRTSTSTAQQLVTDYRNSADRTLEWITTAGDKGSSETLVGPLAFYAAAANESVFPDQETASTDYSEIFNFYDDFDNGVLNENYTHTLGTWVESGGVLQETATVNNETNLVDEVDVSDDFLIDGWMRADTRTAGDTNPACIGVNNLDTGSFPSAKGYMVCLGYNTLSAPTTYFAVLNRGVEWSAKTSYSWTLGTWYRAQLARVGATISAKLWEVGSSEPAEWQISYTQSNNLPYTRAGVVAGTATASFDNLLMRDYVALEPTAAAGGEVIIDSSAPVISSVQADAGPTSATITWTTDESATSTVQYGLTASYGTASTSSSFVTSHSVTLSGLTAGTTYHFSVSSSDPAGNVRTSTDSTFQTDDISSPVISSISSGTPTDSGTTISWTTDEPADSQVEYGLTSTYTASTSLDSSLVTSHSVTLSGLLSDTLYHYRVISRDASLNSSSSSDGTFTTASQETPRMRSAAFAPGGPVLAPALTATLPPVRIGTYNRDLMIQSRGSDVAMLQRALISLAFLGSGYDTGFFGPLTQGALKNYQLSRGISPAVGYFGPITRAFLENEPTPSSDATTEPRSIQFSFERDLTVGSIGEDVKELQVYLNARGFLVAQNGPGSPGNETSMYGLLTRDAVAKYQAANGISPAIGYFGPLTRAKVQSSN